MLRGRNAKDASEFVVEKSACTYDWVSRAKGKKQILRCAGDDQKSEKKARADENDCPSELCLLDGFFPVLEELSQSFVGERVRVQGLKHLERQCAYIGARLRRFDDV